MIILDRAIRPSNSAERTPRRKSTGRLSGLDAGFLALELREQPMHIMAIAVLRPADHGRVPVQITLDDVRRHLAARLGDLPAFRLRVQPVPFGLHHPVFVEASDIDLDYHLDSATLPAPGGAQELDRLCASRAERRLDRRHPLWRVTLVDRLEGDCQALIFEIHHCLMDGAAMLTTFSHLFSSAPAQEKSLQCGWRPERPPGRCQLTLDAVAEQCRTLARLPALVWKTKRGADAIRETRRRSAVSVPRAGADAPPCSLNAGFTSERRYARASLPLTDIKLVEEVADVTVNDVVLGVVAGALRGYLEQRHDLPTRPLVANVPVGTQTPGDPSRAMGNHITRLVTSLATNVADPWARLRTISAVTRESKRYLDLVGHEVMAEWLDLLPPTVIRAAVRHNRRRRRGHPDYLDTNVTISNTRGPARRWSFGPAVVEEMYIAGPPNSGVGITFVAWDYAGTLFIGILSSAGSVEDPGELASGLSRSLSELVTIAQYKIGATTATRVATAGVRVAEGDHSGVSSQATRP